ncbi:hypothetical protein A7K73_08335 [Candidatus Methylacidiphilum fumarolicum]|nr:hypothetical protein A7K73_08335 [Candidatus Methylacidiphilum fumarolicum]TFE76287.1 hypothetical protein A7D33_10125 [Candidatus Methylacidiphilum fumarolicum]
MRPPYPNSSHTRPASIQTCVQWGSSDRHSHTADKAESYRLDGPSIDGNLPQAPAIRFAPKAPQSASRL